MKKKHRRNSKSETAFMPKESGGEGRLIARRHGTTADNGSHPDVTRTDRRLGWIRFWFTPTDPISLHIVRLLSGLLFLFWLLTMSGHLHAFFGLQGWFDVQAYREAARLQFGPPVPFGWSFLYLPFIGENPTVLTVVFLLSLFVLLLFTLGIGVRVTSVLTWVIVVSFLANPTIRFGADYLLVIFAFYLMIGYLFYGQLNGRLGLWQRIVGPLDAIPIIGPRLTRSLRDDGDMESRPTPSYAANLAVRLIQVHFAVVVVAAALHKLQMAAWWSGTALWYPLHPPFSTSYESVQNMLTVAHRYLFFLSDKQQVANVILFFYSLVQYCILAWQLAFPFFAWRSGWPRAILLGGAALGWLGSVFVFSLPLFGPVWFLGCLCFVRPQEWRALLRLFATARPVVETKQKVETPSQKLVELATS